MGEVIITPIQESNAGDEVLEALLTLNAAEVPHVGELDLKELRELLSQSYYTGIARDENKIAGFIVAMLPGVDYQSLNYRWFAENYERFLYVDRIVVAPDYKGRGIGRRLYQAVADHNPVDALILGCEVNLKPLNQDSLDFHARLGFSEVGQQDTEGGKKRVSLLALDLHPS
ncbi:GNAT family N-acetyltransferase [Hahella ganghwensis]|uniref:GNAT family N-acetyltransferase n=1 Tax=Hahella ganghwensis TaxID=286420 RepID=UPI000368A2FB|nr:GNAT family N-acetyltransferase [Hahella ganghwensis]